MGSELYLINVKWKKWSYCFFAYADSYPYLCSAKIKRNINMTKISCRSGWSIGERRWFITTSGKSNAHSSYPGVKVIKSKITAHKERFLLNNSYLCNVANNPSQTWHRKRLAFSKLMNLDTHLEKWKSEGVLPSVMIVGGLYPITSYIGCELFLLIFFPGSPRPIS